LRHHRPTPRITAGALLARESLATAMIDVSDGLIQDLGHICKASGIGAQIWQDRLPLSRAYRKLAGRAGTRYALSGGEDYELLFCARKHDRRRIEKLQRRAMVAITRIGSCDSGKTASSFSMPRAIPSRLRRRNRPFQKVVLAESAATKMTFRQA
jgi:thiamine-monophosphate kinase